MSIQKIENTYNYFFSQYYDELYHKNNYQLQAKNLVTIFKKNGLSVKDKIIDIGCGTGEHALHIAQQGYHVYGIDPSSHMIKKAKEKTNTQLNLSFNCGYIESLSTSFQGAYSLFNVINCLDSLESLNNFLFHAGRILSKNALFVIETWHTEQVLREIPVEKNDSILTKSGLIKRTVKPTTNTKDRTVLLDYNYMINNQHHNIIHHIKLFTKEELSQAFSCGGFSVEKIISSLETCFHEGPFEPTSRYITYILKKDS